VPGTRFEAGVPARFERDKGRTFGRWDPSRLRRRARCRPTVDGYRIDRQRYYVRDPGLEPDELAALNLAATTVTLDGVEAGRPWKLGGVVEAEGEDPPSTGALAALPADPTCQAVFPACAERRDRHVRVQREARVVEAPSGGLPAGPVVSGRWNRGRGADPQLPTPTASTRHRWRPAKTPGLRPPPRRRRCRGPVAHW